MKVLFTTDGSPASAHALREATRLLPLDGADATLVGIADLPPAGIPDGPGGALALLVDHEVQAVRCALDQAVGQLAALGVAARPLDGLGDPPTEIRDIATRLHADLIVLGSHGRNWLERTFAGSVSERVVHGWHGAALVVRPAAPDAPPPKGPVRVLVCADGSAAADHAIDEAVRLLALRDAEVTVVTVSDVGIPLASVPSRFGEAAPAAEEVRARTRVALAVARARLEAAGVRSTGVAREGTPGPAISALAAELGADVVVIGSHGRGPLARLAFGSVSDHLLRHGTGATFVVVQPA